MNGRLRLLFLALAAAAAASLAPGQHQGKPVMDDMIHRFFLADQLEHHFHRNQTDALRWNAEAWIGGDYNRLWINTEGIRTGSGDFEDADIQVLYGRLVAPYWDFQGGARYFKARSGAPSRGSAVIGVQGLAPYRFEVQAATFISHKGEVSGRAEVEYDLLLTQRLIAQPRVEVNLAVQSVRELGIGSGFNNGGFGVRLRYEIRREFAPYVGLVWTGKFGQTADFARLDNDPVRSLAFVLGVRVWH